ncbi:hypothetical protein LUZ60_000576 [Juncus effusus]|nr:hypothetical protein LUZ60_000576 [Juncus effusus]
MASFKQACNSAITIFYLFLFLFVSSKASSTAKTGFSLELIHRYYSPSSPFYRPNLTFIEYESRLQYLTFLATEAYNTTKSTKPEMIRPPLFEYHWHYMVALAIGTGSGRNYYKLHIDTGSALAWIQCVPCRPGFRQEPPVFDPKKSPTYKTGGCVDKLCKGSKYMCLHGRECAFYSLYGDNTYSSGDLAYETFSFVSDRGYNVEEQVKDVAFGCAHSATAVYPLGGAVGILGLSLAPDSFLMQLKDVIGARFSYCLARPGTTHHLTLRFGTDILVPDPKKTQNTRIVRYSKTNGMYFLKLIDISIGTKRMNFRRGMFERQNDGKGGTIIDSGTVTSRLMPEAFEEVCNELRRYFRRRNIKESDCAYAGFDFALCFEYPTKPPKGLLPDMTWHFEGADYKVGWPALFSLDEERGYLVFLLKSHPLTVLGAIQQVDYRFIYDGNRLTLSFAPEDCSNTD